MIVILTGHFSATAKNPEMFDWKEACVKRELEFCHWSNVATKVDYFVFEHGLYGAVDTVHLTEVEGSF